MVGDSVDISDTFLTGDHHVSHCFQDKLDRFCQGQCLPYLNIPYVKRQETFYSNLPEGIKSSLSTAIAKSRPSKLIYEEAPLTL